jgi:hypothetical protein
MFLAGLFRIGQLIAIQRELIDAAPIERRRIHGETWGHGSIGPDDHVILPGTAVLFAEAQFSVLCLHNPRGFL